MYSWIVAKENLSKKKENNCAETDKTGNIVHQGFPLKFWFLQTWIICIKGHGDQCGCKGGD